MSGRENINKKWKRERGHWVFCGGNHFCIFLKERITECEFIFCLFHRIDLFVQFDFYIVSPITINIVITYSKQPCWKIDFQHILSTNKAINVFIHLHVSTLSPWMSYLLKIVLFSH